MNNDEKNEQNDNSKIKNSILENLTSTKDINQNQTPQKKTIKNYINSQPLTFNIINDTENNNNNKIKNKQIIFKINKIPKEKKKEYDLIEKNENNQFSPLLGKKRQSNKIDYSQMYNNSNGLNNFGIEPMKMIQIEKFINTCLDSNDLIELEKLFLFFDPNNYIINPISFIEPNIIYSQQNRERDMYNSMKAYLNENYNNQSTNDLSGKTNSDNSLDNEKSHIYSFV